MEAIKAEQIDGAKWRLLAIPFGGPFGGKDLDAEFFSENTDIKPRWFRERPVIFQHGRDSATKDIDFGTQELDDEFTAEGWWSTIWLDKSNKYWAEVDKLLRAGKLYGSSGALSHLVRKNTKSGELLVWPHAEQTLTPTPINFYSRITATKALPDLEAITTDLRPDLLDGEPDMGDLTGGDAAAAMERLALRIKALEVRLKAI